MTLAIRRYYGIEAVEVVGNVTDMAMDMEADKLFNKMADMVAVMEVD